MGSFGEGRGQWKAGERDEREGSQKNRDVDAGLGLVVREGLRCGCLPGDTPTFQEICITCQCFGVVAFFSGW